MSSEAPFSPMRRAPKEEALAQLRQAKSIESSPDALDSVSAPVAVINEQRQVVFANRAFQELSGAGSVEDICGNRPGEIFGCINAKGACGESAACSLCGAAQAILETQRTGAQAARECHIVTGHGRNSSFDLVVQTTPFEVSGQPYILVSFSDISDQRRHQALERIFFHDILNTVSSFKVYLDLLKRESTRGDNPSLIARLQSVCDTLVEEIQGQRLILSAANRTLRVQSSLIESKSLAEELIGTLEGLQIASGRKLQVAPGSTSFTFISDDTLVKRILSNMLKNALEASAEGSAVTLAFAVTPKGIASFEVHNLGFIEPAVQKQIFSRFFSTKGRDRGLGTWGMRLLAEEYLGGSVSFTSTPEDGTRFLFQVPLKPGGP